MAEFDAPIYSTLLPESEREREVKWPVGPINAAKIFWHSSAEISDAAWHRWASVADDLGIIDDPNDVELTEDEFNRIKGDRNIPYSPSMTRARALRLNRSYDYAEWLDHYQPGLKRWSSAMLGGFAGGLVDPVTVATYPVGAGGLSSAVRASTFRGMLKGYISASKKMSLAGVPAEFVVGSSAMGEPDNQALLGAAVAPWVLNPAFIGVGRLFRPRRIVRPGEPRPVEEPAFSHPEESPPSPASDIPPDLGVDEVRAAGLAGVESHLTPEETIALAKDLASAPDSITPRRESVPPVAESNDARDVFTRALVHNDMPEIDSNHPFFRRVVEEYAPELMELKDRASAYRDLEAGAREVKALADRAEATRQEQKELTSRVKALRQEQRDVAATAKEIRQEQQSLAARIQEFRQERNTVSARVQEIRQEQKALTARVKEIKQEQAALREARKDQKTDVKDIRQRQKALTARAKEASQAQKALTARTKEARQEQKAFSERVKELRQEQKALSDRIKDIRQKQKDVSARVREARQEQKTLTDRIQELRQAQRAMSEGVLSENQRADLAQLVTTARNEVSKIPIGAVKEALTVAFTGKRAVNEAATRSRPFTAAAKATLEEDPELKDIASFAREVGEEETFLNVEKIFETIKKQVISCWNGG